MSLSGVAELPAIGERRIRNSAPPATDGCAWYPIAMAFQHRAYWRGEAVHAGTGETAEISSRELRVRVPKDLPLDIDAMELSIAWPVQLDGVTPLQWIVKAKPTWRAPGWMFVSIVSYEFRTAGSRKRLTMSAFG